MTHVTIHGRRWFQRSYGNTYHTVTVEIDGKHVYTSPEEYGYGDQYIQTAMDWIESIDGGGQNALVALIPKRISYDNGGHEALWQWAERTGMTYSAIASDVSRQRDL